MYIAFQGKFPIFVSDFNENCIFTTDSREMVVIKFHENPSVRAELFHADGQTDRHREK